MGTKYYSEADDIRQAEALHGYDRDDAPRCNHACCLRLRAELEALMPAPRKVVQVEQDWMFDGKAL